MNNESETIFASWDKGLFNPLIQSVIQWVFTDIIQITYLIMFISKKIYQFVGFHKLFYFPLALLDLVTGQRLVHAAALLPSKFISLAKSLGASNPSALKDIWLISNHPILLPNIQKVSTLWTSKY